MYSLAQLVFTEQLPSNGSGIDTDSRKGFMKYAAEMGSGATIGIPSFIKIVSGVQKVMGGYTDRQLSDRISLLLFFPNKESRLKMFISACAVHTCVHNKCIASYLASNVMAI
jgi:hypothetical protein